MSETAKPLDLRGCDFFLSAPQRFDRPDGKVIDFYTLANEGGSEIIGLSTPHARPDIAEFALRCLSAGQKLMRQLKADARFRPDAGDANAQDVIKRVVRREASAETILAILSDLQVPIDPQQLRERLAHLRGSRN
jgi:hypothetical protein